MMMTMTMTMTIMMTMMMMMMMMSTVTIIAYWHEDPGRAIYAVSHCSHASTILPRTQVRYGHPPSSIHSVLNSTVCCLFTIPPRTTPGWGYYRTWACLVWQHHRHHDDIQRPLATHLHCM